MKRLITTISAFIFALSLQGAEPDLSGLLRQTADRIEKIDSIEERLEALENQSNHRPDSPFQFTLHDEDGDGFVDNEWEAIIAKGQAIQRGFWLKSEKEWTEKLGKSPSGKGWFGTAESPVITISCEDPVYYFKNTARLPGRFRIWCPARWGTFLRFLGNGDKVLIDDNKWGTQTNAPIGIYVETSTDVGDIRIRNFEQTIQNVMVIAQNGTMPIYLAENPFNLQISDCNIQYHQGARIGIKHGPALFPKGWEYPVKQHLSHNVYLPDAKFINIQMEGRHKLERLACGFLLSGNNPILQNINFYGVLHGIYLHGGMGRVVTGCTLHHGATANGRSWAPKDQFVLVLMSQRAGHNPDTVEGNAGPGAVWLLPKGSRAPATAGWHMKGEKVL